MWVGIPLGNKFQFPWMSFPVFGSIRHTVISRIMLRQINIGKEVHGMLNRMCVGWTGLEVRGMEEIGGAEAVRSKAPGWKKARGCAMTAAALAAMLSMGTALQYPAYSDTLVPYGPGAPASLYAKDGVTDVELAMIEDVYNGVMTSQDGSYCTEAYYPLDIGGDWVWALEVCRFYSVKPEQIQLCYDESGSRLFRVSVSLAGVDMDTVRAKEAAYTAEVERLAAEVEGRTAEEKVRFFHDYLVGRCEYDQTLSKSRAYDCLVDGSSVCNGYAAAFYNLCRAAGLEAGYIAGTATVEGSGRIAHAWNRIKMEDGQWHYYDVTWDDGTGSYRYYGLTEDEMSLDHFPEQVV